MSKRVTGNDEYMSAARRFIAGAGRRVAEGDIESLAELRRLRDALDAATETAVAGLLAPDMYSLTDVARVLGVTRQYAWRKFHHLQTKEVTE